MAYSDGVKFMFTSDGRFAGSGAYLNQLKILNFTVVNDDRIIAQPANAYTYRTYMGFGVQANDYVQWMKTNFPNAKEHCSAHH